MSITVAIACAISSFVSYVGMSNLQPFASQRQVATFAHNTTHTGLYFLALFQTTRKPVEARVRDRVHGVVARYRFQTEATQLAVVRLPPQNESARYATIINTSNSQCRNLSVSSHRSATCASAIVHCGNCRFPSMLTHTQHTTKPTCIARNPSTGT